MTYPLDADRQSYPDFLKLSADTWAHYDEQTYHRLDKQRETPQFGKKPLPRKTYET